MLFKTYINKSHEHKENHKQCYTHYVNTLVPCTLIYAVI